MKRRHLKGVMAIERQVYPRPWSPSLFISEMSETTNRAYLVARLGKDVVAYGGVICYGDEAHITTIAVDPAHHRHKFGTRIMFELMSEAIRLGAGAVSLEVRMSKGLVTTTTLGSAEIELFGMMCDGTVVLGCTELDGSLPSGADLDAQNGHIHDLTDKSGAVLLTSRYHTHVCPEKNLGTFHYTPKIEYYSSCNQN
jgi:GNAT superfamily N-acetyltransferase